MAKIIDYSNAFHLTHEVRKRPSNMCELIVFSADELSGLLSRIRSTLQDVAISHPQGLQWLSYSTQKQFRESSGVQRYRAVVVAYGVNELKRQLEELLTLIENDPMKPFSFSAAGLFYGVGQAKGKLAYLFAGQGAQYVNMGKELAELYPRARSAWETLGEARVEGKSLREVAHPKVAEDKAEAEAQMDQLTCAKYVIPANAVVVESIYSLLTSMGLKPDAVASHSWGDVASYRAANVISPEQMIAFTRQRGYWGATCPTASTGRILMVFAKAEKVQALLKQGEHKNVWIANYNAHSLLVLSGGLDELTAVKEAFSKHKVRSKFIPISGAPHCPMGQRVTNLFSAYLQDKTFSKSTCDVYSYLFGKKLNNDPVLFRKVLSLNCLKSVRFTDQVEQMHDDGITSFLEVGPSDGLVLFVEKILSGKAFQAMSTDKQKGDSNLHFLTAVAEMIRQGRIHNTQVLWESYQVPMKPVSQGQNLPESSQVAHAEAKRLKVLELQLSKISGQRASQSAYA